MAGVVGLLGRWGEGGGRMVREGKGWGFMGKRRSVGRMRGRIRVVDK